MTNQNNAEEPLYEAEKAERKNIFDHSTHLDL